MALLNAQYDAIMRGYDEIRDRHRHELSAREAEIAEKIPEISALDDEAAAISISAAKRRVADPHADLTSFNESLRKITEKRVRLLLDGGYPADYLEMQYDCPHCRDTGYIGDVQCACFRKAATELLYREYSISGILEKENFSHFSFDWYSDTMKDKTTGKTAKETAASACRAALRFIDRIGQEDNNLRKYRSRKDFSHPLYCQRSAGPLLFRAVFYRSGSVRTPRRRDFRKERTKFLASGDDFLV